MRSVAFALERRLVTGCDEPVGIVVDDDAVYVGASDGVHRVPLDGARVERVVASPAPVCALGRGPDGLVIGTSAGHVLRRDASGDVHVIEAPGRGWTRLSVGARRLAVGFQNGEIVLHGDARPMHIHARAGQVFRLALSPDESQLAIGANTAHVLVHACEHGERVATLRGRVRPIYGLSWAAPHVLFSLPFGGSTTVWDPAVGTKTRASPRLHRRHAPVTACAGALVATAGIEGVIGLWSHENLLLGHVHAHDAYVSGLAFASPSSIASVSYDGTVAIHRIEAST